MAIQPRRHCKLAQTAQELFPDNLTPSRDHLVRRVRAGISQGTLHPSDLMVLFMHLREFGFHAAFSDWGHSVAHVRRDRGALWNEAMNIWATQIFFGHCEASSAPIANLPVNVFDTLLWLLDFLSEWQIRNDFIELYPDGITRDEAKAVLRSLYVDRGDLKKRNLADRQPGFVFLVSEQVEARDLSFVR
ncbi:MAG TPA: hypothetical protein VM260_00870, partial [Pirellula sp.]|nr:hypothetical protein [Pirellula sp.]